jgi:hypothetical protein
LSSIQSNLNALGHTLLIFRLPKPVVGPNAERKPYEAKIDKAKNFVEFRAPSFFYK